MNADIYTAVAEKLEAPAKAIDDLLVEALGNDDGELRKAIYRITLCEKDDLETAQKSLFEAFAKYFGVDEMQCAADQKRLNDQYTDLIESRRFQQARELEA